MSVNASNLGHEVEFRNSRGDFIARGKMRAFCDAPMAMLEDMETGEQTWWRADMAQVIFHD